MSPKRTRKKRATLFRRSRRQASAQGLLASIDSPCASEASTAAVSSEKSAVCSVTLPPFSRGAYPCSPQTTPPEVWSAAGAPPSRRRAGAASGLLHAGLREVPVVEQVPDVAVLAEIHAAAVEVRAL